MTILYLCEKPSQARDIARVLNAHKRKDGYIEGSGLVVTWCIGHLLELAPPEHYRNDIKPWRLETLPVIPEQWVLFPVERTKPQLNIIKKLLKTAKTVVIACDADREGDVIGREILEYCKFEGEIKRLWLSALDETSIKKALADLKPNSFSYPLYQAGICRQRADWLVGMNMTMAATVLYNKDSQGVLSVGRVQTPTLKLIVDRDLAIENFKSQDYFTLKAQFTTKEQQSFWAHWKIPEYDTDEEGRCLDKHKVDTVAKAIQDQTAIVESFTKTDKKVAPPLCLSLSSLQKLASSLWGFSAKETLEIAQALYEKHKATTYPRTDCGYLAESQWQQAERILNNLRQSDSKLNSLIQSCTLTYHSPAWNDKKITAHHGIIPTQHSGFDIAELNQKEYQIYDLIRRYYIAQFLGDYQYQHCQALLRCKEAIFTVQSHNPTKLGWKQALDESLLIIMESENMDNNEEAEKINSLPVLTAGSTLACIQTQLDNKKTKPPAHYTEGTLISSMKAVARYVSDPVLKKKLNDTSGLGTEATRANIIETLFKRNYIEKQGKKLVSTQKARLLLEKLPVKLKDPLTTAFWEQALEKIAIGQMEDENFVNMQINDLKGIVSDLKNNLL